MQIIEEQLIPFKREMIMVIMRYIRYLTKMYSIVILSMVILSLIFLGFSFQTVPDGDCLFRAILQQISHPASYTMTMMRHQVVNTILRHMSDYEALISYEITNDDGIQKESAESYLRKMVYGKFLIQLHKI